MRKRWKRKAKRKARSWLRSACKALGQALHPPKPRASFGEFQASRPDLFDGRADQ